VLAHVSKAHAEADGPRRPFGGVYVVNTARSTIEARRVDDADDARLVVTTFQRKPWLALPTAKKPVAFGYNFSV